ncbi:hypothetical protein FRC08_003356 [Ceratobasidium sp. 394]|nr:hypothetical protein FRC08_003356 [Ceratobasidium sp. 394]
MTPNPPGSKPLLGDGNDTYRIAIVGNSGTGKTTLAVELSELLGIPYLSLDEVHWQPGWVETPAEEFRQKVEAFLLSHPDGWIIDGNYQRKVGTVVQDMATDVLCMMNLGS